MNILVNPLFEYTQNNHLRYQFVDPVDLSLVDPVDLSLVDPADLSLADPADLSLIDRQGDLLRGSELRVQIGTTSRAPLLLIDEAAKAAQEIYEKMPKPLVLCLSSGIDSQCLYQAFVRAQVPFEIATFRYHCKDLRDLNIEDTSWVFNNLRFRGHKFQEINIDLFDFYFSSEHWNIAAEAQCQSPQLTCHMKALSLVKGTPILSWNIPNIYRSKNGAPAINVPNSKYFSYHRFLHSRKIPGVPFFFLYTPELFFSSLYTKTMRDIFHSSKEKKINLNYSRKMKVYAQGGFTPEYLQKRKLTGFELFKDWLSQYMGGVDWSYDLLFRTPLELRYPNDKRVQLQISAGDLQAALGLA